MQRVETEPKDEGTRRDRTAAADIDTEWPASWPESLEYLRINAGRDPAVPEEPFLPRAVASASPSIRFVYACFRLGSARSVEKLQRVSGLPARTVRHAVRFLVKEGLMQRIPGLSDARRIWLRAPPRGTALHASAVFGCE